MILKASKTLKNPFTLKSHHLIVSAAAFTILATTSALWAQPGSMTTPNTGASTNVRQAKHLSAEELVTAYTKADVNKDGKLSRQEAENVPGLGSKFDQIDANGDQFVSKVEFEIVIR